MHHNDYVLISSSSNFDIKQFILEIFIRQNFISIICAKLMYYYTKYKRKLIESAKKI